MTRDDAAVRDHLSTTIPAPRTEREPGRSGARPRVTRPPSQYWDVASARWVTCPQVPAPRASV